MAEDIEVSNLVTRLSIDDSGVEKSMADLARRMKTVQSEFQAASSRLGEHSNAQDALKTKADSLSKQMEIQGQRIAKLKKQHEEAAQTKGKDAKETQNLETKLNKAVTQYNKLHNELKTTTAELDKQTSAWHKTSQALDAAAKRMDDIGKKMTSAGKELSLMVTAPIVAVGAASAKASIDFETAFTGVRKTVEATEEEFKKFETEIRGMAKTMPAAATEIAGVAEAAGQLGVKNEALMSFTKTMTDLGVTTNMSANNAATSLARLANITQMPQENFDRLGSTIVALGNNLATTEAEITEMALRLAGAGKQIGLSEAQILAFAGSLSSVGIEAEAGGSAFSRVMIDMATAAQMGGKDLNNFAAVAGMSVQQFKTLFQQDASAALIAFIEGLGRMSKAGENTFGVLESLGLSEIRVRDALLRASNAGDLFRSSLELGSKAWEENTALTNEANTRYETTASKLEILGNRITDAAMTLGDALVPAIMAALDALEPLFESIENGAEWFAGLDAESQQLILTLGLVVAAAGPLLIVTGKIIESIGFLIPVVKNLGNAFIWLTTTPWGLIVTAVAGVVAAFFAIKNSMAEAKSAAEELAQAQQDLQEVQQNGIDRSEIEVTQEKIDKLKELTETYEKVTEAAANMDSAKMGNNVLALNSAAKELNVDMGKLEDTARQFGITLEYIDENGKISARSLKQLTDATKIYNKAVNDAKRATTAEINDMARQIAVRRQEITGVEDSLAAYKKAKKGTEEWSKAHKALAQQFPQFVTATGINVKAIEGLLVVKKREIELEWASMQMKAREAKQEIDTAIAKREAAIMISKDSIMIATSIQGIAGSSSIAEAAVRRMNQELAGLRGEAAALQALLDMKPGDFNLAPIVIPTGNAPGFDYGEGKGKKGKGKGSGGAKAYENKALDEAYKQLEHKKNMDQLTLESELKTLEAIKAKHIKTADERMEIEERLHEVRKALGDRSLEKALDDLERAKDLGKLSENDEINRLKRIKKLYADSAEERKQIDDMIYEATKRKVEAEKQLRKEATEYVSQQLQAALEDRLAREKLSEEEIFNLQDKLLNDQIYLNKNYLQKVLNDRRYSANEKKQIEREVTETIRKQVNERLKLQREYAEETRKQQVDSINKLSKGVQDALRAKYQEEKRAAEDRIKDAQQANEDLKKSQLDAIKSVHDSRVELAQKAADAEIAAIESTYNARIEAIQKELDALNEAEKQKSRAELDAEDARKISRLQGLIEYEHDDFNKAQLQKELNKVLAEQEKRHQQEQLQDRKDALKTEQDELKTKQKEEIDLVKQQLAQKKEIMAAEYQARQDNINAMYNAQKVALERQMSETQAHYGRLLEARSIQAEAEKMIVQNQQSEIIDLLKTYEDSYKITGQSLGEKMVDGFKSKVGQITSLIASLNSQIDAARNRAVAALAQPTAVTSGQTTGGSSKGIETRQGTVVEVIQHFNTPVTSPSDINRATVKAAQQLALKS